MGWRARRKMRKLTKAMRRCGAAFERSTHVLNDERTRSALALLKHAAQQGEPKYGPIEVTSREGIDVNIEGEPK